MKRPQYVFRPNLNDPQHRRAWALLQQMPSVRRKEFLVQSILAAEQADRLEKSIRKVVREELQTASIATAVPSPPPDDVIPAAAISFLDSLYRQMAEVRALTDGQWPYPTYQAWRNGGKIIQQFKQSGNRVLFAAGFCWEGIDFPGNMVSLLIIAKLPFPIPDPVSDYERRQYSNLRDYINAEVIPEMQKKLRPGFGRAIRTEHDSCVVVILDERAGIGGKYHDAALAALPTCPITEKIEDMQQFIREQKRPDYFL